MTTRLRLALLIGIVVVMVLGAGGYVWYSRHQVDRLNARRVAGPGAVTQADLTSVAGGTYLVFRTTALAQDYGRVALARLDDPDGPRAATPASCDRVSAVRGKAVCLAAESGFTVSLTARLLGADWTPTMTVSLPGIPSRARLSRDGSLIATTAFIHGDSYASPGQFSTRTQVTRADGGKVADLEEFALVVDGKMVNSADRNMWGVTFADNDQFYATAASGGRTWLVRGSLSGRRLTALVEDAECPSLSPDRTKIVFKRRGHLPAGQWRLTGYDLATGAQTALAETRSVDDQVDWFDDTTVVYGLPRPDTASTNHSATSDIWAVPTDGTGAARLLVHDAWSPTVVR